MFKLTFNLHDPYTFCVFLMNYLSVTQSLALILIPQARRCWTTSLWPVRVATCKGELSSCMGGSNTIWPYYAYLRQLIFYTVQYFCLPVKHYYFVSDVDISSPVLKNFQRWETSTSASPMYSPAIQLNHGQQKQINTITTPLYQWIDLINIFIYLTLSLKLISASLSSNFSTILAWFSRAARWSAVFLN